MAEIENHLNYFIRGSDTEYENEEEDMFHLLPLQQQQDYIIRQMPTIDLFSQKLLKRNEKQIQERILFQNVCVGCGIDLGECNPRQYCCKTYCPQINS